MDSHVAPWGLDSGIRTLSRGGLTLFVHFFYSTLLCGAELTALEYMLMLMSVQFYFSHASVPGTEGVV